MPRMPRDWFGATRAAQRIATTLTVGTVLAQENADRVVLVLQPNAAGVFRIAISPTPGAGFGLVITSTGLPFTLNWETHGPLVGKEWVITENPGGLTCYVLELIYERSICCDPFERCPSAPYQAMLAPPSVGSPPVNGHLPVGGPTIITPGEGAGFPDIYSENGAYRGPPPQGIGGLRNGVFGSPIEPRDCLNLPAYQFTAGMTCEQILTEFGELYASCRGCPT